MVVCPPTTAPPTPRHGWWLAAIVIGLVGMQFVTGRMRPETQRPGTERNDLVLRQEDLPLEIHGWKQSSFEAAKPAEYLPEGQFWWVHAWQYQHSTLTGVVTFDQLGLNHWHELTQCYQGNGWELKERIVRDASDASSPSADRVWEFVIARFEKPTGEKASLVFSTFYEDGSPCQALRIGIDHNWDKDVSIAERLTGRMNSVFGPNDIGHTRALQCQVFLPHTQQLTPELEQSFIDLHLTSREEFRRLWKLHTNAMQAQLSVTK